MVSVVVLCFGFDLTFGERWWHRFWGRVTKPLLSPSRVEHATSRNRATATNRGEVS